MHTSRHQFREAQTYYKADFDLHVLQRAPRHFKVDHVNPKCRHTCSDGNLGDFSWLEIFEIVRTELNAQFLFGLISGCLV